MKKIVLIFFVLFLFIKVNAQNQIKGKVTDINNEPLIGASVSLPELNKGTITNQAGEYLINNIPPVKKNPQRTNSTYRFYFELLYH